MTDPLHGLSDDELLDRASRTERAVAPAPLGHANAMEDWNGDEEAYLGARLRLAAYMREIDRRTT